MKYRLAVVLLFLVTLGLALTWFGVFSTPPGNPNDMPAATPPPPPPPGLPVPEAQEPKDEPQPEYPGVTAPTRVMILGQESRSFTAWLLQLFEFAGRVEWQTWYAAGGSAGTSLQSKSLPALSAPPTPRDLDGVHVLIVSGLDPAQVSGEFWSSVADRVRAGSLGLLLCPDHATGLAMSEIPALKSLSPIAKAKAVAPIVVGGPIAGVYSPARPILLAADAVEHPATRIVPWKGWNERWWDSLGRGDAMNPVGPWSTKFCMPIETLAPGARVLAKISTGLEPAPALVATTGDARILWVGGFFDIDFAAYKDSRSVLAFRVLLHNWVLWLAPPKA